MPKKLKTLIRKADEVHSKYIRLKYARNGYVKCITCGRSFPVNQMDCGHFVARQYMSLRYDERNTFPQCRSCNRFHEGVKDSYAAFLVKTYGAKILEDLQKAKHKIKQWTPEELEELIKDRQGKIKELERK